MKDSVLVDELRQVVRSQGTLIIAGTGVSVAATDRDPVASWTGLLRDGVDYCEAVLRGQLPPGWRDRAHGEIESGDLDELLSAAEKIASRLGAPNGGEYKRWLRRSIGRLRVASRDLIDELLAFRGTLATTNYDHLLEDASGRPAITWRQESRVERVLRGDATGIVHFHGEWEDAESVILGIRDYERSLGSAHAQAMMRAIRGLKTLVFIGCGDGLVDPNWGALWRWARGIYSGSEYRHYVLARAGDAEKLRRQHPNEEQLAVIEYGERYDELVPFLRGLARGEPAAIVPDASSPPGGPTVANVAPAAASEEPCAQPFVVGNPIDDPRRFFGRTDEIRRITQLLMTTPSQHACIVGPPRSGKTSLLMMLRALQQKDAPLRDDQQRLHDRRLARHRWIYVDFHDPRFATKIELCRYLLEQLGLPVQEPVTAVSFGRTMSAQLAERVVIMLDEMGHALTHYKDLDDLFWKGLRSLFTTQTSGRVSVIVASHMSFPELMETTGHDSPFANIIGYSTTLGPLDPDSADALIRSSPVAFSEDDRRWILEQSGRWPILLQLLCRERLASWGEPGNWREAALQQARPYLRLVQP